MRFFLAKSLCIGFFVWLVSASVWVSAQTLNLTQYVNPFIGTNPCPTGTGGFTFDTGDVFPGATTPEGMVQFSPDTPSNQAGGYWYPDTTIKAFSLTHFSGRGIPVYGDFGFYPVAGAVSASTSFSFANYTTAFSHSNETALPGYYKVVLNNNQTVELTDTTHTGMMQATYPSGTTVGTIFLNMANNVRGISAAAVSIVNGNEVTGYATSTTSGGQAYTVYISVVFDQTITASGTWNGTTLSTTNQSTSTTSGAQLGAYVSFKTSSANEVVHATAGISYVSIANAELNRTTENPSGTSFSTVEQNAGSAWNTQLNHIQITDPNASVNNLTVFYTEFYHTLIHPNIFDDVNGQYIGFDNAIHTLTGGHHHYTDISGWDLYRSASPLKAFLLPGYYSDVAQSMVDDASQSGYVGRWIQQNSDSAGMIGDGGIIELADAYAFGATNFDTSTALTYMNDNASGSNGYRAGENQFLSLGWVYNDGNSTEGSSTLEYAVSDMAMAQFSQSMGNTAYYQKYQTSAQYWRNMFNASTLYLTSRNSSGGWDSTSSGWAEGSQGQYTWMVPFNQNGLFTAMGGNANVVSRLDAYFGWNAATQMYTTLNANLGSQMQCDGNEPDESQPWAYLYAGAPWKTQKVMRDIQTTLYTNTPGGLPGNDDGGAESSRYVLSALGIYPLISGVGGFVIGSPLFASATVTTDTGHVLQINGTNAAPGNPYVQSFQVNGVSSTSLWLPVSTILNNPTTTLGFTLGSTPNTSWGTSPADAPPSFDAPGTTTPTIATAPSATPSPVTGTTMTLSVLGADTGPNGEPGLTYTWSTTAVPTGVATPTFGSGNGTNAGKNLVATFYAVGSYTFQVAISNGLQSVDGTVSVTVNQAATGMVVITPSASSIYPGCTQQFSAFVADQFGNAIATSPLSATWSVTGGSGSIGASSGLFQAATTNGATTIQAVSGSYSGTTTITVVTPPSDVTNGLVGRWNFEEGSGTTAHDTSGNSNNGTLEDVTGDLTWFTPGAVGEECLSYPNGTLEYVKVPDASSLDPTTGITLSAWVNVTNWNQSESANPRIMEKGNSGGANSGDNQYRLLVEDGVLKFDLTGVSPTPLTAPIPTAGVWHLIAGTYNGSTMSLYVDNVMVASQSATGAITTQTGSASPLILGGKNTVSQTTSNILYGLLDDARVYNRGLSPAEMTTLYNAATASPWFATAAAASPASVLLGSTSTLSVLGADVNGESILNYTWQTTGTPPAPVTFSANGTNSAKQTVASFTQPGTYNFLVTATDPQGRTATSSVSVSVTTTFDASFSSAATVPLTANGFTATGLSLSLNLSYAPSPGDVLVAIDNTSSNPISGTFTNLPNNGIISTVYNGITYYFTANYAGGGTGNDLTLTLDAAPAITSANSTAFTLGQPGSFTVTATGKPAPAYTESGFPSWVALNPTTGVLSGTPTATGAYTGTITAGNGIGTDATQNFSIAVQQAPLITNGPPATAAINAAYSFAYTANGYPAPTFSVTSGALPTGLTLSSAGVISGTPTAIGTYTGTVSAGNGVGTAATQNFSISIVNGYTQWANGYFGSGSPNGAPAATPENDGVPNLLKYLYDINPTTPMNSADLAALSVVGLDTTTTPGTKYITLTYRENPFASGLTINVQTSSDLQTWTTVSPPDLSKQVGTDLTTGDPIMEVGVIVNSPSKQFIRLNVITQ